MNSGIIAPARGHIIVLSFVSRSLRGLFFTLVAAAHAWRSAIRVEAEALELAGAVEQYRNGWSDENPVTSRSHHKRKTESTAANKPRSNRKPWWPLSLAFAALRYQCQGGGSLFTEGCPTSPGARWAFAPLE